MHFQGTLDQQMGRSKQHFMKWDAPQNSMTLKETSKISNYQMKSNLLSDFFGHRKRVYWNSSTYKPLSGTNDRNLPLHQMGANLHSNVY